MAEAKEQKNTKVVIASARHLHIAPRKMRLVTNLVKNSYALEAIAQLTHSTKKAAPMVVKLIKSALANAEHNFSLDPEAMFIKSITADQGKVMKRYFPRARGSAFVIRRKMSHVNVVLEERKRKGSSPARAALFKRLTKKQAEEAKAEAAPEAGSVETKQVRKPRTVKTSEQVKANRVQQKRRLFNRKAGE